MRLLTHPNLSGFCLLAVSSGLVCFLLSLEPPPSSWPLYPSAWHMVGTPCKFERRQQNTSGDPKSEGARSEGCGRAGMIPTCRRRQDVGAGSGRGLGFRGGAWGCGGAGLTAAGLSPWKCLAPAPGLPHAPPEEGARSRGAAALLGGASRAARLEPQLRARAQSSLRRRRCRARARSSSRSCSRPPVSTGAAAAAACSEWGRARGWGPGAGGRAPGGAARRARLSERRWRGRTEGAPGAGRRALGLARARGGLPAAERPGWGGGSGPARRDAG